MPLSLRSWERWAMQLYAPRILKENTCAGQPRGDKTEGEKGKDTFYKKPTSQVPSSMLHHPSASNDRLIIVTARGMHPRGVRLIVQGAMRLEGRRCCGG